MILIIIATTAVVFAAGSEPVSRKEIT